MQTSDVKIREKAHRANVKIKAQWMPVYGETGSSILPVFYLLEK
jgi:hypothetical protein